MELHSVSKFIHQIHGMQFRDTVEKVVRREFDRFLFIFLICNFQNRIRRFSI